MTEQPADYSSDDDLPVVEDANAPEPIGDETAVGGSPTVEPLADETAADIESESIEAASPPLECVAEPEEESSDDATTSPRARMGPSVVVDDTSDVGAIEAGLARPGDATDSGTAANGAEERSAYRIVVELKRIEAEVRSLIEARDSKRKRKLGGTRRWYDLEEDLIAWRYTGRFDEPTLTRLRELITKRHYLFRRLHFLAGTRAGCSM